MQATANVRLGLVAQHLLPGAWQTVQGVQEISQALQPRTTRAPVQRVILVMLLHTPVVNTKLIKETRRVVIVVLAPKYRNSPQRCVYKQQTENATIVQIVEGNFILARRVP